MEQRISITAFEHVNFPCTCEVWGDESNRLLKMKKDVNLMCDTLRLNMQCINVSVIYDYEVGDDLVGAWVLQLAVPRDHVNDSSEDLHSFLRLVKGQMDGTAEGFAQISIVQNHSHRSML